MGRRPLHVVGFLLYYIDWKYKKFVFLDMPSHMAILFTDFFVVIRNVFWFKSQSLTTPVKINITCRIWAERAGNCDSFDTGYSF